MVVGGGGGGGGAGSGMSKPLRRTSTMERYAPYSWGPHTHPMWEQRRSRKKNRVAGRWAAAAAGVVAGASDATGGQLPVRPAPNEVISNEDFVIVFVGGVNGQQQQPMRGGRRMQMQQQQQQPVLVPKLDLSFVHQPPGVRQHLLKQIRSKDEHQVREQEARALAFAHKYQMQHAAARGRSHEATPAPMPTQSLTAPPPTASALVREHRRVPPARKSASDTSATRKAASLASLALPQSASMPLPASPAQRKDITATAGSDARRRATKKKTRWFTSLFGSKYAAMTSDGVVRV